MANSLSLPTVVLTNLVSAFMAAASPAHASAVACRDTFPLNTVAQFEYLHQISGFPDYTSRELGQMNEMANQLNIPAAKLYERVQALRLMSNHQMALALNNGELIQLAAITRKADIAAVKKTFETLLMQVSVATPVGGEMRLVKVPHKILARLTALSILTGESPGSIAFEFNERFPLALKAQPRSPDDMIFALPPVEVALKMTTDALSPALNPADAVLLK